MLIFTWAFSISSSKSRLVPSSLTPLQHCPSICRETVVSTTKSQQQEESITLVMVHIGGRTCFIYCVCLSFRFHHGMDTSSGRSGRGADCIGCRSDGTRGRARGAVPKSAPVIITFSLHKNTWLYIAHYQLSQNETKYCLKSSCLWFVKNASLFKFKQNGKCLYDL